ncbi:MAG: DUF1285 domain-containing protein [Gammaproteobacteria bacterium]|jgi:hypothetical protein
MSELKQILADIEAVEASSEAKRAWNPEREGEIDIRIAADGRWYHEGRPFQRDSLVRLFASVLRREPEGYFLVTPAEKLRIEVEDAPFVANLVERIDTDGGQAIVFTTNTGSRIVVDREHALRVEVDAASGEPRPYVRMHDGLEALIGRGAFFELANFAEERERSGMRFLYVTSLGETFELGRCDGDAGTGE